MSLPEIVGREEWTRARVALLEHEKALTKAREELAAEGRSQLIVDHYMFDPSQVRGTHYYLELTALGRQEDWQEPEGRASSLGPRADQPGAGRTAAHPG